MVFKKSRQSLEQKIKLLKMEKDLYYLVQWGVTRPIERHRIFFRKRRWSVKKVRWIAGNWLVDRFFFWKHEMVCKKYEMDCWKLVSRPIFFLET
jgi:hypothetical protein